MTLFTVATVTKADVLTTIVNAFKAAGWSDVASAPTTEWNVLKSQDAQGRPIFFQIRPYTGANTTQNFNTTAYTGIAIRNVKNYTPNATPGSAGTFENSAWAFNDITLAAGSGNATSQIPLTTTDIKVYTNITSTRGYVAVRWNSNASYSTIQGGAFFVGIPDEIYINPDPRRAVILAGAVMTAVKGNDNPFEASINEGTAVVDYSISTVATPKNPDLLNRFILSPIYIGIASIGFTGKLDQIYYMPSVTVIGDGDIVVLNGVNYETIKIANAFSGIAAGMYLCMPK